MNFQVGDEVEVLLHARTNGFRDTGGGWSSEWEKGRILKIHKKTVEVRLYKYYFSWEHRLPFDRVRKVSVTV